MRAELSEAITLLRRGDAASVERALALLQATVFAFSMKVCGQREDAEDTMQDVLMQALPHLAKLDDAQALSVWLYTVARNRCWRSRKPLARRRTVPLEDLLPSDTELAALLASHDDNPEQLAAARQDEAMVRRAVLDLPPSYRLVLVLHDMEELDTGQVAQVLGLKPGTVRVRLHRARLLVRRTMDRLLRGEPPTGDAPPAVRPRPARCREVFGNLSEYLDGRLALQSCVQLERHIAACPSCIAFIQDLKAAMDRCRSLNIPMGEHTGAALRRLLTDEYLRLLQSGSPPVPAR